jgi:hypothetical protein
MTKLDDLHTTLKEHDERVQDAIARLLLKLTNLITQLEASADEPPKESADIDPQDPAYNGEAEYWQLFGEIPPETAWRVFNDWLAKNAEDGETYADDDGMKARFTERRVHG